MRASAWLSVCVASLAGPFEGGTPRAKCRLLPFQRRAEQHKLPSGNAVVTSQFLNDCVVCGVVFIAAISLAIVDYHDPFCLCSIDIFDRGSFQISFYESRSQPGHSTYSSSLVTN